MVTHARDALPEMLVGRYRVRGVIGRGGAAIVHLAEDRESAGPVALKVLRADVAAGVVLRRFMQEIRVARTLAHPNILPVVDSGEIDGRPMYVMRYVSGGTLRQLLDREGALPFDAVVRIVGEVAAALDHAHAHGIAHRDIKPENILFDEGRAVVADFGIARAFAEAGTDRLTESGIVIGTPCYMSPEQAGSDRRIDGRTDVYSLGCVAFEMLGGEPPFRGASAKNILARHMQEPPPPLGTIRPAATPAMERVLARALAKVPADRYQTAGEFAKALAGSARGRSVRTIRRIRRAATAAVTALLALAALLVGLDRRRAARDASAIDAARRVAVLYFDDLTPDQRLRHVAAGLTEDLIDRLSQVSALHVISPNGVRPYRDSVVALDSLAQRLGVGTVIAGNVTSAGGQVRVSVRMVDATTGRQLDGRSFERRSTDLLALQDTLTGDIAYFLRQRVGREVRLRTQRAAATSAEAWELVQRAQQLQGDAGALIRTGRPGAIVLLTEADSLLARAERLDPRWDDPTVARSRGAATLAALRPAESPDGPAEARLKEYARALAHADRALARHPRLPEALAARGEAHVGMVFFGGARAPDSLLRLAERDLEDAASARPDVSRAWVQLGFVHSEQGRFEDAAAAFQKARDVDAWFTNPEQVASAMIYSSLQTGDMATAGRWCSSARARHPRDPRFLNCEVDLLGWAADGREDVETAWRKVREIERGDSTGYAPMTWSFRRMMVAAIAARSGLRDSARNILARTEAERRDRPPARVAEAYVRVLLGEHGRAITTLREFAGANPGVRAQIARSRWFEPLRSQPAFRAAFPADR